MHKKDQMAAPNDVWEAAADWCDRLETLTEIEREALRQWLAEPEHARAFDRMARTMRDVALLEAAEELETCEAAKPRTTLGAWLAGVFAHRAAWGVLVGATAAVCLAVYVQMRIAVPPSPATQLYATATAQRRDVTLADKSVVYLNADTRLAVAYSDRARTLYLTRGEAIFQVTKDKARPFRVHADALTVTAVGTRFGVDRFGHNVEVRVYEGTVKVEGSGTQYPGVTQGQWLLIDPQKGVSRGNFSPEQYDNWRTGWLEAERMPLAAVIAHLNRYTDERIAIADASLAAVKLNGRFRLDKPADTLQLIAALLDAGIERRDHKVLLRPRHE